jgi:hypothetical protein
MLRLNEVLSQYPNVKCDTQDFNENPVYVVEDDGSYYYADSGLPVVVELNGEYYTLNTTLLPVIVQTEKIQWTPVVQWTRRVDNKALDAPFIDWNNFSSGEYDDEKYYYKVWNSFVEFRREFPTATIYDNERILM